MSDAPESFYLMHELDPCPIGGTIDTKVRPIPGGNLWVDAATTLNDEELSRLFIERRAETKANNAVRFRFDTLEEMYDRVRDLQR